MERSLAVPCVEGDLVARVQLKRGKTKPILCGHPWIFSGAIARHEGDPDVQDVVEVVDDQGRPLGYGLWSPQSQIRVRMLTVDGAFQGRLDIDWLIQRLTALRDQRRWLGLPSAETNSYRLVNSEGDGLPGLVVDVLGHAVVMQCTTRPMARRREVIREALTRVFSDLSPLALREVAAPKKICRLEGMTATTEWWSDHRPAEVDVRESGVAYSVRLEKAQKTGHYLDMRPHRVWLAAHSAGRRVLDGYCYTGGFGLHAARGKADAVVCVDSSAPAIAQVEANASRNGFDQITAHCGKVDDFLRGAQERGERFDIIVLDPPKLAVNRRGAERALKVYEAITLLAVRCLTSPGLLCITSCSEAIDLPALERVLGSVQGRSGGSYHVVYSGYQGPDHPYPAAMREGRYATFLAAMVRDQGR